MVNKCFCQKIETLSIVLTTTVFPTVFPVIRLAEQIKVKKQV